MSLNEDHPRIHGEHCFRQCSNWFNGGSPPHTRGTPDAVVKKLQKRRITPAYTGNTRKKNLFRLGMKDHPRIHGEHNILYCMATPLAGSPPHTRGTHGALIVLLKACRITPAYTGNTVLGSAATGLTEDHPRIHGEHRMMICRKRYGLGSPPHTRGTPGRVGRQNQHVGITPAYTGNTREVREWQNYTEDHPRIHGEHKQQNKTATAGTGSPPHTRGTPSPYMICM